jgi:hypothetical protein
MAIQGSAKSFGRRLDNCEGFDEVFGLVKESVLLVMGKRRGGLILGLSYLPNHIGAFHQLSSNFIVMNKGLLEMVVATKDRSLVNAYVFHILLHEYIHSLGFMDETQTQAVTFKVSESVLGKDHISTRMAMYGLHSFLSDIEGAATRGFGEDMRSFRDGQGTMGPMELYDIDKDNLDYIG